MGTDAKEDYYALLGLDAHADATEVRRSWRRLALKWHPDRAGPDATATFQRISAAYTVLSDPVARAAYDRRHPSAARSSSTGPKSPRRPAPAVMLSRLCGSLNGLLARRIAR